jgi:Bacterial RNA polymerase, alpha chain C terminal domain
MAAALHKYASPESWKSYPVRVHGPRLSTCHNATTLLVQSMKGGFVTANCSVCWRKDVLKWQEFRNLPLWVSCPNAGCRRRMHPHQLSRISGNAQLACNYGYACSECRLYILLADILPPWEDLAAPQPVVGATFFERLSIRASNCLESVGISSVDQLCRRTEDELLEIRNFGLTTLREVKDNLTKLGKRLRQE